MKQLIQAPFTDKRTSNINFLSIGYDGGNNDETHKALTIS